MYSCFKIVIIMSEAKRYIIGPNKVVTVSDEVPKNSSTCNEDNRDQIKSELSMYAPKKIPNKTAELNYNLISESY